MSNLKCLIIDLLKLKFSSPQGTIQQLTPLVQNVLVRILSLRCLVKEVLNIFQQPSLFTLIKYNRLNTFSIYYYRPLLSTVLVLIETGFVLNKVSILSITLRDQFPKILQRSTKVGNRHLFLATKISSLILTLEHKQTAFIPYKKPSILGRVIQSLFVCISAI